jgi:hypothetical protein
MRMVSHMDLGAVSLGLSRNGWLTSTDLSR